jgi:transcriptional regulator with XRE-family HTH domain
MFVRGPLHWHHVHVKYTRADWERLGRAIVARRVELGFNTQKAFADHLGLTPRILGDIEGGKRDSYDRATLARVEQGLQWRAGTAARVLDPAFMEREIEELAQRLCDPEDPLIPPAVDNLLSEYRLADDASRELILEQVRRIAEWARWRRTAR